MVSFGIGGARIDQISPYPMGCHLRGNGPDQAKDTGFGRGDSGSIGITANSDQHVMAKILSTLISESTGTKVNIVEFQTLEECREAMKKEELDLYLDYVCSGLMYILNGEKNQIKNAGKAYSTVKHLFNQKLSFIWLKPFGYDNSSVLDNKEAIGNIPNQAVCVARKKVLSRFPILPRLINKLKNKISNETLTQLQQSKDLGPSVKAFLESKKLIRWAIPQ